MAGRLLFKETTAKIENQIAKVLETGAELDKALAGIEKLKDLIKMVGQFLTLADKALDAIKLL